MPEKYTALASLGAPGTIVFGYRRGDEIPESVVEAWGLVEGEDYTTGELDDTQVPTVPRPGPENTRVDWERWAVSRGMDPEDAAAMPQDELEALDDQPAEPERPAVSATKAVWVEHVVSAGADRDWAESVTKADLQKWQPGDVAASGDPVAESATEQANG